MKHRLPLCRNITFAGFFFQRENTFNIQAESDHSALTASLLISEFSTDLLPVLGLCPCGWLMGSEDRYSLKCSLTEPHWGARRFHLPCLSHPKLWLSHHLCGRAFHSRWMWKWGKQFRIPGGAWIWGLGPPALDMGLATSQHWLHHTHL